MTLASPPKPRRIPELDGVRGVACLLVILWHYVCGRVGFEPGTIGHYFKATLRMTYTGVDLFFVLSGFLLGGILIEQRLAPNLLRVFYARRACRLLPLYFAWLGLFLALRPWLADRPGGNWMFAASLPAWTYATYLQNFFMAHSGLGSNWLGVTWSLAVEEQFYLLLPAFVLLAPPRWLPWLSAVLVVVAPVFRTWMLYNGWNPMAGYVLLPARWDGLFFGVLAAWLTRRPGWSADPARTRRRLYAALVLPALAVGWLMVKSSDMHSDMMLVWGFTAVDLFYAVGLLLVVAGASWAAPLRWRWLGWVGLVSYGVYMFHQAMAGLVFMAVHGTAPVILSAADVGWNALALALTFLMAGLSYRYFESPFLRLGHHLRYDHRDVRTTPPGANVKPAEPCLTDR